jgi:glycylpeptide N-tetradecanoyltransferase
VATTVPYKDLITSALILAKNEGYDLYSCLNLMENRSEILSDLHFKPANTCLNYYLFNWVLKCRKINPDQVGVVMF